MVKIAVLGGGLSAAFATRALLDNGITPDIFAARIFTEEGGNIWVHWMPESMRKGVEWQEITIVGVGTKEGYASKMWKNPGVKTSFVEHGNDSGISPLSASTLLWGSESLKYTFGFFKEEDIRNLARIYDYLICTFPLPWIYTACRKYKTPIFVSRNTVQRNFVVYQGSDNYDFVRVSQLFGFRSYEYPPIAYKASATRTRDIARQYGHSEENGMKLWLASELPTDAEPLPLWHGLRHNILVAGRYAQNSRKLLSHDTYNHVIKQLTEKGELHG